MRTRTLAVLALLSIAPAQLFAAPSVATHAVAASASTGVAIAASGDDCGRGNAWGCRRKRGDDRYDRYDDRRDRYDRDRYEHDRYERERWERERWARERYEQERYERARWERERAREEWRWRNRDRRYSRYDGYPVACVRAGGRIIGSAVLVICVP